MFQLGHLEDQRFSDYAVVIDNQDGRHLFHSPLRFRSMPPTAIQGADNALLEINFHP
jgi:hypothetical protein